MLAACRDVKQTFLYRALFGEFAFRPEEIKQLDDGNGKQKYRA
jgi:hypothetical protein